MNNIRTAKWVNDQGANADLQFYPLSYDQINNPDRITLNGPLDLMMGDEKG